ncbi:hypothetical protein ACWA1C_06460 [Flectobacillus roseus]
MSKIGLIDILLQKRICFVVIAANAFGGYTDNFIVVHENDAGQIERISGLRARSGGARDCRTIDLEGDDYKSFKRNHERFESYAIEGGIGRVYELVGNNFKDYRAYVTANTRTE